MKFQHPDKVLLPGVTILERFIAEIRARMETRLWTLLGQTVNADQRSRLEKLLTITDDGGRQSWFDKLRKGPVRISAPALVKALACICCGLLSRTDHAILMLTHSPLRYSNQERVVSPPQRNSIR